MLIDLGDDIPLSYKYGYWMYAAPELPGAVPTKVCVLCREQVSLKTYTLPNPVSARTLIEGCRCGCACAIILKDKSNQQQAV